jgi:hypothetical protein
LVKLYVTPTDDDTLGHVKLIDVAFDETVVQDPMSVGAETCDNIVSQKPVLTNVVIRGSV